IVIGKSTTKDQDFELAWSDRGFWDGRAFVLASGTQENDSTERFFGFGNESKESAETNYTSVDTDAQVTPGVWVLPYVNLAYTMRIRRLEVERGEVSGIPFIGAPDSQGGQFNQVHNKGLEPGVYWTHRLALTYDSRDEMDIPSKGGYAVGYTESAERV